MHNNEPRRAGERLVPNGIGRGSAVAHVERLLHSQPTVIDTQSDALLRKLVQLARFGLSAADEPLSTGS